MWSLPTNEQRRTQRLHLITMISPTSERLMSNKDFDIHFSKRLLQFDSLRMLNTWFLMEKERNTLSKIESYAVILTHQTTTPPATPYDSLLKLSTSITLLLYTDLGIKLSPSDEHLFKADLCELLLKYDKPNENID